MIGSITVRARTMSHAEGLAQRAIDAMCGSRPWRLVTITPLRVEADVLTLNSAQGVVQQVTEWDFHLRFMVEDPEIGSNVG